MSIIRKDGFNFGFDPDACETCPGYCCRGESGTVWVNQQEIIQISSFLKTSSIDFIQRSLIRIDNRFSIKERLGEHGLECVFFDSAKRHCSIYAVRPLQCREFPFWEHFKKHKNHVAKECPGIIERGVAEKNSLISNAG